MFNEIFGTAFEMLPDTSYYSVWDRPYEFRDMTDVVNAYAGETAGGALQP